MRAIYFPGIEGPFKSLLAGQTTFYNSKGVSEPEKKCLSQLIEKGIIKENNIVETFNRRNSEEYIDIDLTWYAADAELKYILSNDEFDKVRFFSCGILFDKNKLDKLFETSAQLRNKSWFYNHINNSPLREFISRHVIISYADFILKENELDYPIIIKSSFGKGGKGNLVCFNYEDFIQAQKIVQTDYFKNRQEYREILIDSNIIVEAYQPNCRSFNATFFCNPYIDNPSNVLISEQIIEEVFYRGNIYNPYLDQEIRDKILSITEELFTLILKPLKFEGWIGIDFLYLPNNSIRILEINPRVNSVTHGFVISSQMPFKIVLCNNKDPSWTIENLMTDLGSYLNQTKDQGILLPYQISKPSEFLLISFGMSMKIIDENLEALFRTSSIQASYQRRIGNYSKSISFYISD